MNRDLAIIRGLHPGVVLERELKKRKLNKGSFALSVNEYPQTIGAIIKGKRNMNTPLSIKIEQALDLDEGYFMVLQVYYDIKQIKERNNRKPDFSLLRPALFWDTDMAKINWDQQKGAVIKRVFERGKEHEKKEITSFYGKAIIDKVIKQLI